MNSNVEPVSGSDADQVRLATISQVLVIGDTCKVAFIGADQKGLPDEDSQPDDLRAVDTALESWDRTPTYNVSMPWVAARPMVTADLEDELANDQLWGDGDLDWFLVAAVDSTRDAGPGGVAAAM